MANRKHTYELWIDIKTRKLTTKDDSGDYLYDLHEEVNPNLDSMQLLTLVGALQRQLDKQLSISSGQNQNSMEEK